MYTSEFKNSQITFNGERNNIFYNEIKYNDHIFLAIFIRPKPDQKKFYIFFFLCFFIMLMFSFHIL